MKNELALRDLGRAYANAAGEFLAQKYGSQVELGELCGFYASATSWMTAKAFALVFQKVGPMEAETFLRQVLSGISASVRIHKVPAMVIAKVTVELTGEETMPASEASEPPLSASTAPASPEEVAFKCACKLKNGRCAECAEKTASRYKDLADYLLVYMKTMAEKTQELAKDCPTCAAQYSDLAISAIAHEYMSKKEPQEVVIHQMLGALLQVAEGVFGVTEIPLTQKILDSRPATQK